MRVGLKRLAPPPGQICRSSTIYRGLSEA